MNIRNIVSEAAQGVLSERVINQIAKNIVVGMGISKKEVRFNQNRLVLSYVPDDVVKVFDSLELDKRYTPTELEEMTLNEYTKKRIMMMLKSWCIKNELNLKKFNTNGVRSIIITKFAEGQQ